MNKLFNRITGLNVWVQVILIFCLLGTFINFCLAVRDLSADGVLLRLHAGFLVLYASQVIFILLHERYVCVLAAVQGLLALLTNLDFTFVPFLRILGQFYYVAQPVPSVEAMSVYKYVFVSAAFTLQMLSAYALFALLPKYERKKEAPAAPEGETVLEK